MKIVLLGYMGSGKSTIGRLLAERLTYRLIDLDAYIEENEGKSISDIFEERGEIYFRKKEAEYVLKALNESKNIILSLGGGTPCYGNNIENILKLSEKVIYLQVSVLGLSNRLQNEKNIRPLIKNIPDKDLTEFIGKHLFERSPYYQKSNYTVECDNKEVQDIVLEIEQLLV